MTPKKSVLMFEVAREIATMKSVAASRSLNFKSTVEQSLLTRLMYFHASTSCAISRLSEQNCFSLMLLVPSKKPVRFLKLTLLLNYPFVTLVSSLRALTGEFGLAEEQGEPVQDSIGEHFLDECY